MSAIIFKLNNVPEDEATDIRELLSNHNIDFYETAAGNWGASMPAIWVSDTADKEAARLLIDTYQAQRVEQARALYQQQKQGGTQQTLKHSFHQHPLRLIVYSSAIILIIYLSFRLITDLNNL